MAITLRGSINSWVNGSSFVLSLTTGWTGAAPSAGDRCVIFTAHGFDPALPSGWSSIDASTGQTNVNGLTFEKVLTAADITAGSVTISFGGSFNGIVAAAALVGSAATWTNKVVSRNSSGAGPRTLTTEALAVGAYVFEFSMMRLNGTITISRGSTLQSVSNTNASGKLNSEAIAAAGSIAPQFSFSSTPSGDYEIVLAYEELSGLQGSKLESAAWVEPGGGASGATAAKIEAAAWLEPPPPQMDASKMEVCAWIDPPGNRRRMSLM